VVAQGGQSTVQTFLPHCLMCCLPEPLVLLLFLLELQSQFLELPPLTLHDVHPFIDTPGRGSSDNVIP
jgi:hypothetical protein